MGFLSRLFRKPAEASLDDLDKVVSTSLRLLKVDLCEDLSNIYSSQMNHNVARVLAAQVVNFLMGDDIDENARASDEPLRSRIMAILPQVRQRASEYMQSGRETREIIVVTHRMKSVLNFGKYGTAWLQDPAKTRIERLLVEYGPEFPEEMSLAAYTHLFTTFHAVKRIAWER